MPDDDTPPRKPKHATQARLDADAQGERSLAFLDALYDEAQDEAMASDDPPTPAAHRLAVAARLMVADLSHRLGSDTATQGASAAPPARARSGGNVARISSWAGDLSPDTGRILALSRDELEQLVTELQHQRGDTAMLAYDYFSDDELRQLARGLRAPDHR